MIRLRLWLLHITVLFSDPDYVLKSIPAGKSITVIICTVRRIHIIKYNGDSRLMLHVISDRATL